MKKFQLILLAIGLLAVISWMYWDKEGKQRIMEQVFKPNDTSTQQNTSSNFRPEVISNSLTVPWEIAFLPNGEMLTTERIGNLKHFAHIENKFSINGVKSGGEGGLLGLAIHPNFTNNNFIYLYFTTNNQTNKVVRYRLANNQLTEDKIIIDNIPGASNHNGGRIAFGPDQLLYITTGDAQETSLAQNTSSLAGKILRLRDDGSLPNDNPFGNAVYSYGHRNPQGLAWDSQRRLWSTEHGRSGLSTGFDELNLIEKGANYGWPVIQGEETKEGMRPPVLHSGPNTTWAPAGMVIVGDKIYFVGLRGQAIYETKINGNSVNPVNALFFEQFGRLRAITFYDGYLYFSTSNRDGRGRPATEDDRILKFKL